MRDKRKLIVTGKKKLTYRQKITTLFGASLNSYWPMNETAGAAAVNYGTIGTAGNGTYTGVDLASTPGPTKIGGMAPYFDGANDHMNYYSADFAAAFTGNLWSISIWWKVSGAADWTDSTVRVFLNLRADANNIFDVMKLNTNDTITFNLNIGGNAQTKSTAAYNNTNWNMFTVVWSKAANYRKMYMNATEYDSKAGANDWAGAPSNANCMIGAYSATEYKWKGYCAHAIMLNRVMTPTEITTIYNWGE